MTILNSSVGALRLSLAKGETLIVRNYSGVETVTGSTVSREDASSTLGAGAVVYGPQSVAASIVLSTSGTLDYQTVMGDPTPAVNALVELSGGSPVGIITPDGRPVGGGGAVLVGADKVRLMLSAIRTGGWQRVNLAYHGHSIIAGACSDDSAGFNYASAQVWRQRSVAAMLSHALNGVVGGVWSGGFESMVNPQQGRYTLSGAMFSAQYSLTGPAGFMASLNTATDTITFTAEGSAVKVYAYASVAGTVLRYKINGGTTQSAAAAPSTSTGHGARVWYPVVISGLTVGDSVQLVGATSGVIAVYGVDPAHTTAAGITVHRCGNSGGMGAQTVAAYLDDTDTQPGAGTGWTAAGSAALRSMQTDSVTTQLEAVGVLNMFDVNDIKAYGDAANGTAWGWGIDTHVRHLQNYLSAMAARSLPVVFTFGPLRDPSTASSLTAPFTQADLIDAYKQVIAASSSAAYIDLTQEFTGATLAERYAAQQATGLIYDSVHPNGKGSAYFGAQRIAQALLSA